MGRPTESSRPGDQVLSVNGRKVTGLKQLTGIIRPLPVGTDIKVKVRRDGKVVEEELTTAAAPDDKSASAVQVAIAPGFEFPFDVKLNISENIGGPSGGLMFALGIYDTLTPGSLTDGKVIAGTGEIDADGKVVAIGGIQQKLVGAQDDGRRAVPRPGRQLCRSAGRELRPRQDAAGEGVHDRAGARRRAGLGEEPGREAGEVHPMSPVPDPAGAIADVVREVEAHASRAGWDQPAQLFALVETADLIEREPHLAEVLGVESSAEGLTPVEQETSLGEPRGAAVHDPVAARGGGMCRGAGGDDGAPGRW